jgi:hypothetical protein
MRFALLALILFAGCAKEPFARPQLPVLNKPDARAFVDDFAKSIATAYTSDDTMVISAPFHDETAFLVVTAVDRSANTFELLGLSHVGVKLFHLAGQNDGGVTVRYAIPQLAKQGKNLRRMADDVRRMYFDLAPPADARIFVGRSTVRYSSRRRDGTLFYKFGGDPAALLEKKLMRGLGNTWRVRYYDYMTAPDGKKYPRGIVVDHDGLPYRVVVKNRTWTAHSLTAK